jgi:hypothetical protein
LDALEAAEYDVIPGAPRASKGDILKATWRVFREEPEGE